MIRAEHQEGKLVVTIQDNGIGMNAREMNQLLEQNDIRRVESGVSIGILNVNARLKKAFGKEYGLRVESRPGEGTTVRLTVPAVLREEKMDNDVRGDECENKQIPGFGGGR